MSEMPIIEVKNLNSGYGKLKVLFDINMAVEEGKLTVLVGPNGAGKTTLLNSIMNIATVFSGQVLFEGSDITRLSPNKIAKMGVAYVPSDGEHLLRADCEGEPEDSRLPP